VETFVTFLQGVDPLMALLIVFAIALFENLFPPSPSDVIVVFAGSLVGLGRIGFPEALLAASAGSTLGFMIMYKIGDWFGEAILERGRIRFIPLEAIGKVEEWFRSYGYWIIIANRFLAGTRAIVSFFAGVSKLRFLKTTVLCALSALVWNVILLSCGYALGRNWERIGFYLTAYGQVVTAAIVIVVLLFVVRYLARNKNGSKKA
jgi:membrane protein DedA with SNARE-associated domain